MFNVIPLPKV